MWSAGTCVEHLSMVVFVGEERRLQSRRASGKHLHHYLHVCFIDKAATWWLDVVLALHQLFRCHQVALLLNKHLVLIDIILTKLLFVAFIVGSLVFCCPCIRTSRVCTKHIATVVVLQFGWFGDYYVQRFKLIYMYGCTTCFKIWFLIHSTIFVIKICLLYKQQMFWDS